MRTLLFGALALTLTFLPGPAHSQETIAPPLPNLCSMDQLVRMNRCQLQSLYECAEPGPIPCGFTPGRAIFHPGRRLTMARARVTSHTLWQGKIFLDEAHLINKVFGIEAVKASVYVGESWLDGKPSIIIDYHDTSWLASRYRDEIREVSPGIYLGIMYERKCPCPELKLFFTLDARCGCR